MINNAPRLGIEVIIKSTHELIESEINTKPETYLLLDTNLAIDSSFCNNTYHTRDFSGLNREELEDTIKAVEFGSELLDNPIIFIVDGVAKEIITFCKIVSEKIKFYNNNQKEGKLGRKKEKFHSSSLENKKRLYSKLNDVCFGLKNKLGKAIYPIEELTLYSQILEEILKISGEENLKRELIMEKSIPRPYRRDRDEELVALAIYLNSTQNRPVSILSKDSDIVRIRNRMALTPLVKFSDIKILNPYGKAVSELKHAVNY